MRSVSLRIAVSSIDGLPREGNRPEFATGKPQSFEVYKKYYTERCFRQLFFNDQKRPL